MERKELFVADLANVFEPKEHIESQTMDNSKWCTFSYENPYTQGVALVSPRGKCPEDINYDPNLVGWYKIYVTVTEFYKPYIFIKLTSDKAYSQITTYHAGNEKQEEFFWRCADMTNEAIWLTKKNTALNHSSVSALRFVPMNDDEVASYKAEIARTDTKKMYLHDPLTCQGWNTKEFTQADWEAVVENLRNADVEWFSAQFSANTLDHPKYTYVSEKARELGIKYAVSSNMVMDDTFISSHPELRCIDRNGDHVQAVSYAYPEVRRTKIEEFIRAAKHGADAVEILANTGVAYVLFEKPVADAFFAKYGEYPFEYTLDDPKLRDIHSDIIAEFFSELRDALDNEFGKNKVQIHLRGFNSIEDCAYLGFDVYKLAGKGLINAVETHEKHFYEIVPEDIRKENDSTKIDIEKYNEYINRSDSLVLVQDYDCYRPSQNSRGEQAWPIDLVENVKQWSEFQTQTGVKVYHGISYVLDKGMVPYCNFLYMVQEALDVIYSNGGDGVAVFDAPKYYTVGAAWVLYSKAGHKAEINTTIKEHPYGYHECSMLSINGVYYNRYQPIWGG